VREVELSMSFRSLFRSRTCLSARGQDRLVFAAICSMWKLARQEGGEGTDLRGDP